MKKLILFLILFVTFLCPNLSGKAQAQSWSNWTSMGGGLYWRIQRTGQWKFTFTGLRYEHWNWQFRNATDNTINFDYGVDIAPGPIIDRWYAALPPRQNSQILGDYFLTSRTLYTRWRMPSVLGPLGPKSVDNTTTRPPAARKSPTDSTTVQAPQIGPLFGPATIPNTSETAPPFLPEDQAHYVSFLRSPDERKIAFIAQQDTRYYLGVCNLDGTELKTLAWAKSLRPDNDSYCFSPDSKKIAFASSEGNDSEIIVADIDTGITKTVTTSSKGPNLSPNFSPDGSKLTFTSSRDGNMMEAYIVNTDGTGERRLTFLTSSVRFPIFTPDGNSIAYVFRDVRLGPQMSIQLMRIDGSESRVLGIHNPAPQPAGFPIETQERPAGQSSWLSTTMRSNLVMSRDGSKFAHTYYNGRNTELFIAQKDGPPKHIIQQDTTEKPPGYTSQLNAQVTGVGREIDPQFSPDGSHIVYVSRHDGNEEIYSIATDGTGLARLTVTADCEHTPRYSDDGSKVAYISTSVIPESEIEPSQLWPGILNGMGEFRIKGPVQVKSNVYITDSDGSEAKQLTNQRSSTAPAFTANDSKIVFLSSRTGSQQIYVMNPDGSQQHTLINPFSLIPARNVSVIPGVLPQTDASTLRDAVFNRDASKIAFVSTINGNSQISVMNADGSGVQQLTNNSADNKRPSFSPDGSKVVFNSTRDSNNTQGARNSEIYVMNVDGSQQTRLTNDIYSSSTTPTFSPDGTKIVYVTALVGNTEIYLMNADGTDPKRLTTNPGPDSSPVFSPDGTAIVFVSHRDNEVDLYQINVDGTNLRRLTNDSTAESSPVFSPNGSHLAYFTDNNGISVLPIGSTIARSLTIDNVATSTISDLTFSHDGRQLAFWRKVSNSTHLQMVPIRDLAGQTKEADLPPVQQAFAFSFGQGDSLSLFAAVGGQINITKLSNAAVDANPTPDAAVPGAEAVLGATPALR